MLRLLYIGQGEETLFRLFVAFGLLIVVALFTALIAPYFIDWTAYKRDFEQQASRIIGQKVVVDGAANVRLLPLPLISFAKLSVGENRDGRPLMTVDKFSANVELMPFLSGEISIVDMALESPVFNLVIDENGTIAWTDRKELLVDPDQVKLDKLTVTNASFNLSGLSADREISGDKINANISAVSLIGPWRIKGAGLIDGQQSDFDLSTGRLSDDGSIRLKADLERLDKPYQLAVDGTVSLQENILSWAGNFGLKPVSADEKILRNYDITALPILVEGDFQLTPTDIKLPQYRIDIGSKDDPFTLTGDGFVQLKGGIDFQLKVDGRQVDLDRIAAMRDGEVKSGNTLESRIKLFGDVLKQVPVPGFKGEIDLEIPAIIAGDTYIREVSALIRPFGEGWEIARFKSSLPGNTLLEAKGRLGSGAQFGFHGNLLIASRQPSGFAAWASGKVDPAIRKLSSAGLSANITLTPSQISLDQMELILDNNRLTGRVQRLSPAAGSGENLLPAIVANLAGDVVRLDDLRAVASLLAGEDSVSLNNDFDITLKAGQLSGFELDAKNIDTQFLYKGGQLSLARLNVEDFLGAKISTAGQITNLLEQPKGNITLNLVSDDMTRIAAEVGNRLGSMPFLEAISSDPVLSTGTDINIELDSSPTASDGVEALRSRVLVNGQIGGSQISLQSAFRGNLNNSASLWLDASVEAANDNGEILLRQAGLEGLGFDPATGGLDIPLKLNIETAGSRENGYSTILSANNQDISVSANGLVKTGAGSTTPFEFDVVVGAGNVSPTVSAFGYFLPYMNVLLGDEAPFSAKIKLAGKEDGSNALSIEQAQIYGNEFTGNVLFSNDASGKQVVTGDIAMDQLSLNTMSALVTGEPFIDELGGWSKSELSAGSFGDKNVRVRVSAKKASVGLTDMADALVFDVASNEGNFTASNIEMQWNGSKLSGNVSVKSQNGTAVLSSQFTALDMDSSKLTAIYSLPVAVEGIGSVSGSLEGTGKSPYTIIRSLTGSGVVSLPGGKINGVTHSGFEKVIEAADGDGFKIDAPTISKLAKKIFLTGEMDLAEVTAPFSIANGNVQFRNITLEGKHPGAREMPIGKLSFDLVEDKLNAGIRLFLAPGKETVSGADPDVGFDWEGITSDPQLSVETANLEGYLSIRAFENEQRRVEILQANILEKQRFRYDVLRSNTRGNWLEAKRIEAEEKARLEAERKAREEEELKARLEAERQAAIKAEEESKRLAEEAAAKLRQQTQRLLEEEAAAKKAAEQKQLELEAEAKKKQAEQNTAGETGSEAKNGFEVKPLAEPPVADKPDIFRNIEDLLFKTN